MKKPDENLRELYEDERLKKKKAADVVFGEDAGVFDPEAWGQMWDYMDAAVYGPKKKPVAYELTPGDAAMLRGLGIAP